MPTRNVALTTNETYHVYTHTIDNITAFTTAHYYDRMVGSLRFYLKKQQPCKFSWLRHPSYSAKAQEYLSFDRSENHVDVIAYCLMPNHLHLILRQLTENGIRDFMSSVLRSYSLYYNTRNKRKGPLWERRFESIHVDDDSYLLHLTRYVHLNPVSKSLVDRPEDWKWSSYNEYLNPPDGKDRLCYYKDLFSVAPKAYKIFVDDRKDYQRTLQTMKELMAD
jgi:putative transposase